MTQIGWDETTPGDVESLALGDDRIRSLKTSLRQGLSAEHTWPSAGGDAGIHLLGSARAYVGTQSQVSSSGTDGRLMWTSDTSRLFHVGSGGTSYIGGARVISVGSFPGTVPQRSYWAEEFGLGYIGSSSTGSITITFPNSGYSGVPYVQITENTPSNAALYAVLPVTIWALAVGSTSFIAVAMDRTSALVGGSGVTFVWRSIGTRVF